MNDLRAVLEALANGDITVEDALKRIRLFAIENIDNIVRYDVGRLMRRDTPEVVFGEGKDVETLESIIRRVVPIAGRVIISRLRDDQIRFLKNLAIDGVVINVNEVGRIAVVRLENVKTPEYSCRIGIITGGTADVRVAEEAKTISMEMGCKVLTLYDVGVAGLHRVLEAVKRLKEEDVDVVIVVAGMEGALPSVVASLLDVPIIGVPTSVGYGIGGGGIAALYSMLQACPLGLAVVNVDNGVNAGIVASLIGRRISMYRSRA
ncbi:MAG: nickel pincer cofactor biosynthesis protein LarB [Ignisphaera sp.]|nr:nickel pincer cofactor biosynthesis protein LarB [Ignisphaera sp.]MCX8167700.1 nickel pincer cofactor biosynthesis protein LarB [Ignisphaera sp.]MDW8085264.1 nickel pincer cofactor biosynthesis protein LarB [Ignisphaera sp.]